jgi:hypothetical protein
MRHEVGFAPVHVAVRLVAAQAAHRGCHRGIVWRQKFGRSLADGFLHKRCDLRHGSSALHQTSHVLRGVAQYSNVVLFKEMGDEKHVEPKKKNMH